jgi:hypothetical protein
MVESKFRVVTLKKEEWGRLNGRWIKAVNGKERIKNGQYKDKANFMSESKDVRDINI